MGNCLKRSQTDDISLLRDAPSNDDSTTIRHEIVDQPSYYAEVLQGGMHIPSGSLSQMTEEEHVRIAKRIGLIQHLPVGYYDGTGSRRHESEATTTSSATTKDSNGGGGQKCNSTNNNNQFNLTITEDSVCNKKETSGEKEEDCMTSSTLSSSSRSECVICMYDFQIGDRIRYLPCLHTYHDVCIDDWLMRSLTCPSCLEPVDAALLQTYENN